MIHYSITLIDSDEYLLNQHPIVAFYLSRLSGNTEDLLDMVHNTSTSFPIFLALGFKFKNNAIRQRNKYIIRTCGSAQCLY